MASNIYIPMILYVINKMAININDYIPMILLVFGVLMASVGIRISVRVNDTSKKSEEERKIIRPIGEKMTLIWGILIVVHIVVCVCIIIMMYTNNYKLGALKFNIFNSLLQYKGIGIIFFLELLCIGIGSAILGIDDDNSLDDETKNDKFSTLSNVLITPGFVLIFYVLYTNPGVIKTLLIL